MQIRPMLFSESQGTLQMEVTEKRLPIVAQYEWNDNCTELHVETTKKQYEHYGLPTHLQCLDLDNPQGKDAKIWANVMRGYNENMPECVMNAVFAFEGMEYLRDCVVENVTIDRYSLTISVEREGGRTDYTIDINQYPFLRTLLPSDIIGIVRPTDTNEVSFRWIDKGYVIPLKEFTKSAIE